MDAQDYLTACKTLNPFGGFTLLQHCACGNIGLVESRPAEPDACLVQFVETCPACAEEKT